MNAPHTATQFVHPPRRAQRAMVARLRRQARATLPRRSWWEWITSIPMQRRFTAVCVSIITVLAIVSSTAVLVHGAMGNQWYADCLVQQRLAPPRLPLASSLMSLGFAGLLVCLFGLSMRGRRIVMTPSEIYLPVPDSFWLGSFGRNGLRRIPWIGLPMATTMAIIATCHQFPPWLFVTSLVAMLLVGFGMEVVSTLYFRYFRMSQEILLALILSAYVLGGLSLSNGLPFGKSPFVLPRTDALQLLPPIGWWLLAILDAAEGRAIQPIGPLLGLAMIGTVAWLYRRGYHLHELDPDRRTMPAYTLREQAPKPSREPVDFPALPTPIGDPSIQAINALQRWRERIPTATDPIHHARNALLNLRTTAVWSVWRMVWLTLLAIASGGLIWLSQYRNVANLGNQFHLGLMVLIYVSLRPAIHPLTKAVRLAAAEQAREQAQLPSNFVRNLHFYLPMTWQESWQAQTQRILYTFVRVGGLVLLMVAVWVFAGIPAETALTMFIACGLLIWSEAPLGTIVRMFSPVRPTLITMSILLLSIACYGAMGMMATLVRNQSYLSLGFYVGMSVLLWLVAHRLAIMHQRGRYDLAPDE